MRWMQYPISEAVKLDGVKVEKVRISRQAITYGHIRKNRDNEIFG